MHVDGSSSLPKESSERHQLAWMRRKGSLWGQRSAFFYALIWRLKAGFKVKNILLGCTVLGVLGGVLFSPHRGMFRILTDPYDLTKSGVSLASYAPRPIGPLTVFEGVISPDFGGFQMDPSLLPQTKTTRYYPKPKIIGFQMGTYARANQCTLQLEVADQRSQKVSCSQMIDNEIQLFSFDRPIDAGSHLFKLHWEGAEGNTVALYSYEKDARLWVSLQGQNDQLSVARVMWRWLRDEPFQASFYILFMTVSLLALIFWTQFTLGVVCLSVFIGLGIIWRPYSGHDETAHMDMLQLAMVQKTPNPQIPESREAFFNNVHRDMIAADFYRLHRASPPVPNTCPHQLLGHCGQSESPMVLYRWYAFFLQKIAPSSYAQSPLFLRMAVLGINSIMLTLLLTLVWRLGGNLWLRVLMTQLLLNGALIAIFPAITNDVPIMISSMLVTFVFQYLWVENISPKKKAVLLVPIFCLMILMFPLDPGMISVFALLPLLPLVLGRAKKKRRTGTSPLSSFTGESVVKKILVSTFGLGAVALCVVGVRYALLSYPAFLEYLVGEIDDRFTYLHNVQKFNDLLTTLNMMFIYTKSVLGSYVWGHSYLHDEVYWAGLIFLGILFGNGFSSMVLAYDKNWTKFAVALCLILSLSGWILGMMAAYFVGVDEIPIIRDSFLKSRFTTMGLSVVWVMVGIGLYGFFQNSRLKLLPQIFASCWGMMLIVYYFPRFFRIDLY